MKALRGIGASVLIVLFLTSGLIYGQSVAVQILTKGVECAAQGKFKEAKEEFEEALKFDRFLESAKEALKVIEDVTDQKIENKTAIHFFKGAAYYIKGQWGKAIAEYNKTIELNPRLATAYKNRGGAYLGRSQYDQAISDYNKAIELDPRLAEGYYNRGLAYYLNGEHHKAWEDVNKAQSFGYPVQPKLLKALLEALGRQI